MEHPEILFAYAYGSFLEGGPFRDLDIALYISDEFLPASSVLYEDKISQRIAQDLNAPFPVDVRIMNNGPIPFQYHVLQGNLLLDKAPKIRILKIEYVLSRYLDIKPVLDHHLKEAYQDESR